MIVHPVPIASAHIHGVLQVLVAWLVADVVWEVCPIVPSCGEAVAVLQLYRVELALGAYALA
jgi:hypothetical protein